MNNARGMGKLLATFSIGIAAAVASTEEAPTRVGASYISPLLKACKEC